MERNNPFKQKEISLQEETSALKRARRRPIISLRKKGGIDGEILAASKKQFQSITSQTEAAGQTRREQSYLARQKRTEILKRKRESSSVHESRNQSQKKRRQNSAPAKIQLPFNQNADEGDSTGASTSTNKRPSQNRSKKTKTQKSNRLQECGACGALVWDAECTETTPYGQQLYQICCQKGRVRLPPTKEPPPELANIMHTAYFKKNIRVLNSLFAFTSVGAKVDNTVMNGRGPFTYRISGQNHHKMGSLLPPEGQPPKYMQLYIYDTANEIQNRINAMSGRDEADQLDESLVRKLVDMLDRHNHLTKEFRKARDRYEAGTSEEFTIRLIESDKGRQYDLPTGDEVAGLVIGDSETTTGERDVIVEFKSKKLQRISTLHQHFMSLQYPLLFPYGESGFHLNIPYRNIQGSKIQRTNVTIREFYAYQLQTRLSEGKTLIQGGRLFHQFAVDAYTAVEEERLKFNRLNQKLLRAELYNNVRDAIGRGDSDSKSLGRRVILPATFTGGPRYMIENYHDAMAICRQYGNPHLFITITANPGWKEIKDHLQTYGNDLANDRPDVASRVFKMKLDEMIAEFKGGKIFGPLRAVVYTIEFQKRGLPHAHILLWLQNIRANPDPSIIDNFISAEIPDKDTDPDGYELVKKHMMHGPCGLARPQSPCMDKGICTKKYPRAYASSTSSDKNGYIVYKRREDAERVIVKSDTKLDNQYVIPHNMELLKKYNSHINVEWCCTSKAIKYLFKYITKGVDKATLVFQRKEKESKKVPQEHGLGTEEERVEVDEIKNYQECRYLSACEASWRLFGFDIHQQRPAVQKLIIHLEGEHSVVFDEKLTPAEIAARPSISQTMFTQWMETNKHCPIARSLTYIEFPTRFVWDSKNKVWSLRKRGNTIGRIANIHPSSGDRYYLRILINHVRGPTSYEEIKTVGNITYKTNEQACEAMGLLAEDKEWRLTLEEASYWATAWQMRELFVTFLTDCQVTQPGKLWEEFWPVLGEDMEYIMRKRFGFEEYTLTEKEIQQYTLLEIHTLLLEYDKSIADYSDMPEIERNIMEELKNSLMREEFKYSVVEQEKEHEKLLKSLNSDQLSVYNSVMDSVNNSKGKFFFVYGPGGTGKTHVYKTLISRLRAEKKIVLPVATSGIAATLLPGGRTAHSRFKIPIDLHENSMCDIKPNTMLAELLENTSLIIWDEAPMAHRHCFEAVDRTLRDILSKKDKSAADKLFGGITILLGGDFRQILPVIPQGSRQDTVMATINRSYLWERRNVCILKKNMRVKQDETSFSKWILDVGDGMTNKVESPVRNTYENNVVEVNKEILLEETKDPLDDIFRATFPNFKTSFANKEYLRERAILTPRNETVDEVNAFVLSQVDGEMKEYLSADTIGQDDLQNDKDTALYTPEYLNNLKCSGLPNHKLQLKHNTPILMMRNINQRRGLCNGTRLLTTRLGERVLEAEIMTGHNEGKRILIPRIIMTTTDTHSPYKMRRRQFPVRLCYAMTINKSQGQSLENVGLYLPSPVFTHGQLYVALSRVTSMSGLKILKENSTEEGVTNIVYREIFNNVYPE